MNIMMKSWNVFIVLSFIMNTGNCMMECEEEDKEGMMENFMNCTGEYKKEYNRMMTDENVDVEKATCKLVNNLVDTCGELWGLCYSRKEVMRMKNMQVENMVRKNSGSQVDIEKCLAISQYR